MLVLNEFSSLNGLVKHKEMIIRSFQKCGISVPIDVSEDNQIHIQGLEDYAVEEDELEYTD